MEDAEDQELVVVVDGYMVADDETSLEDIAGDGREALGAQLVVVTSFGESISDILQRSAVTWLLSVDGPSLAY